MYKIIIMIIMFLVLILTCGCQYTPEDSIERLENR